MAQSKKKKPSTFKSGAPTSPATTATGTTPTVSSSANAPTSTTTKATQRELLKELRAREAREKKIRNGVTIGVVAVVVLALIAGLIWLIPVLTAKNSTTGTASDPYAITIGSANAPVTIDIYQDYMCPYCGQFERAQTADLKVLVDSGTAKVSFHVMAFLDESSSGTRYSTRAANAFVVVAQKEPDKALAFNSALFVNQPSEGSAGLTDAEIATRAKSVGVSDAVANSLASLSQADFVKSSNDAAFAAGITSTPTIKVNGTVLSRNLYSAGSLRAAVDKAAGK